MSDSILPESTAKRCNKCGETKSVSLFSRDRGRRDGLFTHCKACSAASAAAYRSANPEKEKARAYNAAYYAENREEILARHAARHAANPEKENSRRAAWRAANYDKEKARAAAWRAANPDKAKAAVAAWNAAHPEAKRTLNRNRSSRKRNAGGSHTAAQIKDLLHKQKGKCVYCRKDIKKGYHVDHIVALMKGGSNDITNIQLTCPTCNCSKNAKDPIEFAQQKYFLL